MHFTGQLQIYKSSHKNKQITFPTASNLKCKLEYKADQTDQTSTFQQFMNAKNLH